MEHRLQCCQSKQVRYMETVSHALSLDIREEKAENFDEILRCRENDNLCKKQKLCEQNDDKNEKKSSGSVEEKSLSGNEKEREEQEKQNDATKCAAAKSNSTACHSGDVGEPIRPKIKLQTLLEEWAAEEIRKDYFSPVTKTVGDATNRNRMKTFPEYLILHIKRFYAKEDWTAAKQDCYVLVDDVLDLEKYRGVGKAEEETEMKEEDNEIKKEIKNEKKKKFEANEVLVAVLEELGFPHNLAVNACIATSNGREEECVDWCIQNFENTKMQEEIVYPNEEGEEDDTQKGKDEEKKEEKEEHSSNIVNSNSHSFMSLSSAEKEIIQQITCMGFDEENSIYAYRIIKNEKNKNAQRDGNSINVNTYTDECIQLLLNYSPEEIKRKYEESEERRKDEEACKNRSSVCADGPGVYELYGLITHLGKSANCGHYVCHLNHPTLGWVIYNDRKVAQSKNPPKQFGYIYIYRRKT